MAKNETGFVISAEEKSLLIEMLLLFLRDKEKSRVMGGKARRFVETNVISSEDILWHNSLEFPGQDPSC